MIVRRNSMETLSLMLNWVSVADVAMEREVGVSTATETALQLVKAGYAERRSSAGGNGGWLYLYRVTESGRALVESAWPGRTQNPGAPAKKKLPSRVKTGGNPWLNLGADHRPAW